MKKTLVKKLAIILSVVMLVASIATLSACGEVTLTKIEFAGSGYTESYFVGSQALSLTGLTIKATYSDGSTKDIAVTQEMVSGFDSSKAGKNTITITYEGKTTTFDVTIAVAKIANDTQKLILQSSTMDGVFNPFFYSSAYDLDVIGLIDIGLLTMDESAGVVASDYYPTVAKSYSIYYQDANGNKKEVYEAGNEVVYEMIIKNGMKFSDGSAITAEDVLFNFYVYLDPAYSGSSTLYTLPIKGLTEYRTQSTAELNAKYTAIANKIYAAGNAGYVANADFTEAQYNFYWNNAFKETGAAFAQEIVTYVYSKYAGEYYSKVTDDPAKLRDSDVLKCALGMVLWGFGGVKDGVLTDALGNKHDLVNGPTVDDYWAAIIGSYDTVEDAVGTESAGMSMADFLALAAEKFVFVQASAEMAEGIKEISGLVKGETTVDGVKYETVKVILTEQNPKAILSLGITVVPKGYYTAGYKYGEGIVAAGCELNSQAFMKHLRSLNGAPVGAGPYKIITEGNFVRDGDVYFERNEYFETMGGENVHNANIKYVVLKIVSSGAEYEALEAGDVVYATVSATADVMEDVAGVAKLTPILVDNLGYGYICINPTQIKNLNDRIALTTVLDLSKVYDYYPNGLADVIYRSQSQVSWAYPEGATAIYPYDEKLTSTIEYFKKAGHTFDEATGKFTDAPTFDFYLPSDAAQHPAGGIYLKAKELLATIGVNIEIKVDTKLIKDIKDGSISVYALAWQAAADPDMYQVNHYASAAESVIANGIAWLYKNGTDSKDGTVDVVKLGDTKATTMTQSEALKYLGDLIEEGVKYMLVEERQPIYEKALEVLAQLSIEIPTYQRKNLFIYNSDVINGSTLSKTVTPYWGPLAEIWKVSFTDSTPGNYAK